MNVFIKQKQTHRHKKQTYGYQKGKGEAGQTRYLGVTDIHHKIGKQIYTIKQVTDIHHKIGKQQVPTVQHRELYSISYNNI